MITDTAFDWHQLRHPLVRELSWCLFSEPLTDSLGGAISGLWPDIFDRGASEILLSLERNPAPLQAHLDGLGDKRLGARFEALWAFFFNAHPRYQLLAHGLAVSHQGRTLGALDFLLRDHHRDTVIHCEMTVKFFLHQTGQIDSPASATGPLSHWVGPNPNDSLAKKLRHLNRHQLQLTDHPATQKQFQRQGLPLPQYKVAVVKGYLFHPLGQTIATLPPINPHHLRGEWLRQQALDAVLAQAPDSQWAVIPRPQWLMPLPTARQCTAAVGDGVQQQLNGQAPRPLMLCRFEDHPTAPKRYLVLPAAWPGQLGREGDKNTSTDHNCT